MPGRGASKPTRRAERVDQEIVSRPSSISQPLARASDEGIRSVLGSSVGLRASEFIRRETNRADDAKHWPKVAFLPVYDGTRMDAEGDAKVYADSVLDT